MIERLPKIILVLVAAFGLFVNFNYIDTLSDLTAWSGVEDEIGLFMYSQGVMKQDRLSFMSGLISFGILGAIIAGFVSRKANLSTLKSLIAMSLAFVVVGLTLGKLQNQFVSSIGHRLVAEYPDKAKQALEAYYVQRLTYRDMRHKNALIPGYTGDSINSLESELFRVNVFYLMSDPLSVLPRRIDRKDLLGAYFDEYLAYERQVRIDNYVKINFSRPDFFRIYDTPDNDLKRINNAAVIPAVLAASIFSLMISAFVFVGELLTLGSKSWIKVRVTALLAVFCAVLLAPVFISSLYDPIAARQASSCASFTCGVQVHFIDWLFRFEIGVLRLMSLVAD